MADGISIPSGIRIIRKFAPIHPDFTERVMPFKKHQNPSGNMNDLERPDGEHDPWKSHWVTFQDGIVTARCGLGSVSRLVGVVLCLAPGCQRRKIISRTLTATSRCKLPHSRQIMRIERRLRRL